VYAFVCRKSKRGEEERGGRGGGGVASPFLAVELRFIKYQSSKYSLLASFVLFSKHSNALRAPFFIFFCYSIKRKGNLEILHHK
jgi:hypothetical protein